MLSAVTVLARTKTSWIVLPPSTLLEALTKNAATFVTVVDIEDESITQYDLTEFLGYFTAVRTQSVSAFIASYTQALPQPLTSRIDLTHKKRLKFYTLWDYQLNAERFNMERAILTPNLNDAPDLVISASAQFTNAVNSLENKVLFVINGILVDGDYVNNRVIIAGGGRELDTARQQNLGVLDFSEFGGYTKFKPTPQNTTIFYQDHDITILHITVPSDETRDFIMVCNGRLRVTKDYIARHNPTTITIYLRNADIYKEAFTADPITLNWIERILPDSNGFDISTFDAIRYMTRVNSFILFIDGIGLSVEKKPLVTLGFPNTYVTNSDTTDVAFLSDGTIGHYIISEVLNENSYIMLVSEPRVYGSIADTCNQHTNVVVSDNSLLPGFVAENAALKEIYTL